MKKTSEAKKCQILLNFRADRRVSALSARFCPIFAAVDIIDHFTFTEIFPAVLMLEMRLSRR
jgi:hypothetical protein